MGQDNKGGELGPISLEEALRPFARLAVFGWDLIQPDEQIIFQMQTSKGHPNGISFQDILNARRALAGDKCECGGMLNHKSRLLEPKWECRECGATGEY